MSYTQRSPVDSPLVLDFKSINMSLADGTSFPAPPASPPLTPGLIARPPTPGGGPLSSHPATPVNTSPQSLSTHQKPNTPPKSLTGSPIPIKERERIQRKPLSPASANVQTPAPPIRRRDSSGVRKLLSLSSLRNSFSGTHSSLTLSRTPSITPQPTYTAEVVGGTKRRPSSPSIMSALTIDPAPYRPQQNGTTGQNQAQSPIIPQLRKRKSGSWFRRKSAMFMLDGEGEEATLQPLDETMHDPIRSTTPQSEPVRPAPKLPDVKMTNGAFAEEDVFTSIGR